MLAEARLAVQEHESLIKILDDEQYEKYTDRIPMYERKVSTWPSFNVRR
jgi:hypothetical protein